MKCVVCRVDRASVSVDGRETGRVGRGLLVYVGVMEGDTEADVDWVAAKLPAMRLFNDAAGKMNLSVVEVGGGLLMIPNFTLVGRTGKGKRPSFSDAAAPGPARMLFETLVRRCSTSITTGSGIFGAHMTIDATMDGPVTVTLDSRA